MLLCVELDGAEFYSCCVLTCCKGSHTKKHYNQTGVKMLLKRHAIIVTICGKNTKYIGSK